MAAVLAFVATCDRPRHRRRRFDSKKVARDRVDAVLITGLLFLAGMLPSEVSALRWADVDDTSDGNGILTTGPSEARQNAPQPRE